MQWPSNASEEQALLQGFAFSHCGSKPLLDAIILVLHEVSGVKQSCLNGSHSLSRLKSVQYSDSSQCCAKLQQEGYRA